jgi:CO dehydrogenase maturation factor
VLGNKVAGPADEAFLRSHAGGDLLGCLGVSAHVRAAEQGRPRPIGELEPANLAVLEAVLAAVDGTAQDWARFWAQAVDFHRRNALAWGNARTGRDLTEQIDPGFVMSPALADAVG